MVFENIAASLGMTPTTFTLLLVGIGLFTYLLQERMKDEKKRRTFLSTVGTILIIGIVWLGLTSSNTSVEDFRPVDSDWQERYSEAANEAFDDYSSYVRNTNYYDYEDAEITMIAQGIAGSSKSSKEAMEKALQFVYNNVDYIYNEPDSACYSGTAPNILASGEGQCDTQSIVLISILRRMGIAAKPVGGCIVVNSQNCQLQSFLLNSLQDFGYAPKFTEMSTLPIVTPEMSIYSRAADDGLASRKGGLHAWVTAWDEEEGWLTLEETTGKFANTNCYYYHVELYPTDNNKEGICVSKNYEYAKACQQGNLDGLDIHGLGLSTEVSP